MVHGITMPARLSLTHWHHLEGAGSRAVRSMGPVRSRSAGEGLPAPVRDRRRRPGSARSKWQARRPPSSPAYSPATRSNRVPVDRSDRAIGPEEAGHEVLIAFAGGEQLVEGPFGILETVLHHQIEEHVKGQWFLPVGGQWICPGFQLVSGLTPTL